ncbi:MAG TPA: hypothetical protein VE175_13105, partial [Woeseiaceae bacterium]|nr:hypothetical protein [Woeseiaceae bacterium]
GLYALARPEILLERFSGAPATVRALAWSAAGLGIAAAAAALAFRPKRAAAGYAATMIVLWLGISLVIYPRIDTTRSGEVIVEAAARALEPGEVLGLAGWKEQFLLQWNRPAVHFGYRRHDPEGEAHDAAAWVSSSSANRLLLPRAMAEPCFDDSRLLSLGFAHRQHWLLANESSVLPECRQNRGAVAANVVYYDPSEPYAQAGEARLTGDQRSTATSNPDL